MEKVPELPKEERIVVDYEATASDDVLRNADVLLQWKNRSQKAIANWILSHKACSDVYREKAETAEGKSNAVIVAELNDKRQEGIPRYMKMNVDFAPRISLDVIRAYHC